MAAYRATKFLSRFNSASKMTMAIPNRPTFCTDVKTNAI
jgi:hypothetical protein